MGRTAWNKLDDDDDDDDDEDKTARGQYPLARRKCTNGVYTPEGGRNSNPQKIIISYGIAYMKTENNGMKQWAVYVVAWNMQVMKA